MRFLFTFLAYIALWMIAKRVAGFLHRRTSRATASDADYQRDLRIMMERAFAAGLKMGREEKKRQGEKAFENN